MEKMVKEALNTSTWKSFGSGGGGCISSGQSYRTDHGNVFVKANQKQGARLMFDGEAASLEAIQATNTVKVPRPLKVLDQPGGGAVLVMEHIDIGPLEPHGAKLGEQLAKMHGFNGELALAAKKQEQSVHKTSDDDGTDLQYVGQFGFHTTTCCGFIPQDNMWEDDWVTFYTRHKLQQQLDLVEKDHRDKEARELWSQLQLKIPQFFQGVEITPSLLHGDLWGGNGGSDSQGPVVFDPASFYGHSEYELAIATMFGGFGSRFFDSYHKALPRLPGFDTRQELYKLFHYLNHWNHFGGGYRGQSIGIMKRLVKA